MNNPGTDNSAKQQNVRSLSSKKGYLRTSFLIFICIALNVGGRSITFNNPMPAWLDTYGTFLGSYMFGPVPGAIIGIASNVIFDLLDYSSIAYSTVSIFLGLSVGVLARKGYFSTFFQTMTVAGASSSGSVFVATIVNLLIGNGSTGNLWGDAIRDYLIENGLHRVLAVFIGQLYIEFPDKLLISFLIYLFIKFSKKLRGKYTDNSPEKAVSAAVAAIVLFSAVPFNDIRSSADKAEHDYTYIQSQFNGSNGLPCGHANAVVQTNDGILWIGTYAGLYRYNGSEFIHMDGLTDVRNVNCLYVDEENRLWIGTNDNGVVIAIDGVAANVITSKDGLPSDSIRSIVQSSDGVYYIGTTDGMVSLELKMGFSIKSTMTDAGYIDHLSADHNGNIAALNKEGRLYILNDDKYVTGLEFGTTGKMISCCNFSDHGELFLGTTDGAIYRYRIAEGSSEMLDTVVCNGFSKINNIYPDQDGLTWVCSENGIGYIDKNNTFVKQQAGDFDHQVENMTCDYQGNLWFASSRLGLLRLTPSCIKDIYTDCGLEPDVVNSTAIFGGNLYAGTDDGLDIVDLTARTAVQNEISEYFDNCRIRDLLTDTSGNLWICSYTKGLIKVEKNGEIVSYSEKFPEIGVRVRVCCELNDGSLAVGSAEGLFFIADGELVGHIPFSEEFGYSQALCLLETPEGKLYAGTDGNGIVAIGREGVIGKIGREDGLTSDVILRMVRDDEDGSIYVVTSNCICRYADGKITALDAVPYSNNYDIMIDGDELFIPGSAGIYVFDKHSLLEGKKSARLLLNGSPLLLNSKMGLVGSLTANSFNAREGENGKKVYLSTNKGVFLMDLDNYVLTQPACRLTISEMRLDDIPDQIERSANISVERNIAKIEFVPEIINYTYADPIISYKLEGFDSSWTDVRQSELTSVQYTNLSPGDYVFRLAIRGDDGAIIEESSYSITKEKALYDNAWFRYYMIGVGMLFIGWLSWFITQTNIQHTLALQETKLAMALQQVQMGNETILAIAKTVDAKDLRTSKHSQRVSEYSAMIAREYGFSEEDCENLRRAALLHDIGKIAIPDSVLNKPGRLTDEEYTIMKTHVTSGSEILKDFTLIDHVVEGARFHHERYDGRGYPDGLKGEDIPLYGRIIAIADAFDAMTANRVYRKRQDFDYVMGELHKGRGTQFDPDLLDIFLKLIDDKKIDIDALYSENAQKGEE
ncbi:MAG: HD domain-containing protein [Ruminococcus sp.]|nr:HD domain-containing protein [Ruminococcus sp.]